MTNAGNSQFYKNLKKPFSQPPKWLFAPVWTVIYILLLLSLLLIIKAPDNKFKNWAYILFTVQILLNLSWMPVFFKAQKICAAVIISILLFLCVLSMTLVFYKISYISAILLIPYLLWSGFASVLNYCICKIN